MGAKANISSKEVATKGTFISLAYCLPASKGSMAATTSAPSIWQRFPRWILPIRSMLPISSFDFFMFFVYGLNTHCSDILPVVPGTCLWISHPGQNILFHHNPVLITGTGQFVQGGLEINGPLAQFTEHPAFEGVKIIPVGRRGFLGRLRIIILEMDMPYPIPVLFKGRDGVPPTKGIM